MPIVFLHGVGSDKSVWHPQLAISVRSAGPLRSIIQDMAKATPHLKARPGTIMLRQSYLRCRPSSIERAHICGLSLGGVVAIAMHHAAPGHCASLILADTFAVHPEGRAIYERGIAGSGDLQRWPRRASTFSLRSRPIRAVRSEVVEHDGADRSSFLPHWCRGGVACRPARSGRRHRRSYADYRWRSGFHHAVDLSNELVDLIPDARMQVIAGAGHLTNLEKPDEFNALVGEFLDRRD